MKNRITNLAAFANPPSDAPESSFGLSHTLRLFAQGWDEDPHTFRASFTANLKNQIAPDQSQKEKPIFSYVYEVTGKVDCDQFVTLNYLLLRRKQLVHPLLPQQVIDVKPNFAIAKSEWKYTPKEYTGLSAASEEFKERAEDAFGVALRANEPLLSNVRTAIRSFYSALDSAIESATPDDDEALKKALNLEKSFGTYDKEMTANILYFLFGSQLQFYNGDTIRAEDGMVLVPNYWVRELEQDFDDKDLRYMGYGMKPAVIDFGRAPYPWAFIRINHVHNDVAKTIHSKVGKGQSRQPSVSGRQVFIIGKRNGKMVFKALDPKYFGDGKLSDDRMEILSSLAFGELEADEQSGGLA